MQSQQHEALELPGWSVVGMGRIASVRVNVLTLTGGKGVAFHSAVTL